MIVNHYSYGKLTGKILSTTDGKRRHAETNAGAGIVVTLDPPRDVDFAKHYHKDGAIADRPVVVIPDAASVGVPAIADGVPSGVDIIINGEAAGVSDGSALELTFDLDGEYVVATAFFFSSIIRLSYKRL